MFVCVCVCVFIFINLHFMIDTKSNGVPPKVINYILIIRSFSLFLIP